MSIIHATHRRTGTRAIVVGAFFLGEGRPVVDLRVHVPARAACDGKPARPAKLRLVTLRADRFAAEWITTDPETRLYESLLPTYLAHLDTPPRWQREHVERHGVCGCDDCCDLRFLAARLERVCGRCGEPQDGVDRIDGAPACVSCALTISIQRHEQGEAA